MTIRSAHIASSFPRLAALAVALSALLLVGCDTEIGGRCDTPGSDECVDEGICTNEADGNTCRLICDSQDDCPPGFTCNGVSNTNLNSCQPDDA